MRIISNNVKVIYYKILGVFRMFLIFDIDVFFNEYTIFLYFFLEELF